MIVNVGSTSWMVKSMNLSAYATCKSAMTGLTRSLARELGARPIRVNQILPSRLQRSDIASMALFLAAEDSRMITARNFIVDAGGV